ncbi:hypothetical protein, partial [Rhodopseudomonas sp. B29]|uniref:hypothetical protein n=1 Tax=Rhodopseudomonas sp. B29 TaxID=95607 RepID=UPI001AEC5547
APAGQAAGAPRQVRWPDHRHQEKRRGGLNVEIIGPDGLKTAAKMPKLEGMKIRFLARATGSAD